MQIDQPPAFRYSKSILRMLVVMQDCSHTKGKIKRPKHILPLSQRKKTYIQLRPVVVLSRTDVVWSEETRRQRPCSYEH